MKNLKLALTLLGAGVLLTACGGGGGNGGGGSTPTPTPTPAPTANCNDGLPAFVSCVDGSGSEPDVYTISGTIDENYTLDLDSDKQWVLDGVVRVGSGDQNLADEAAVTAVKEAGVDLTIEPGVHVRGTAGATLIVTRGSRLLADGTAASPITFSSLEDDDFDGLGEWGGIIIQGFAPQYGAGNTGLCSAEGICNVAGEGSSDDSPIYYGGTDEDDDSGIVRYVRIAEGGLITSLDDEVNGLTLQGVGYSTIIEYVHVHNNLDDGVEWFGGTVNARYLVLTGNDDDDIDYDEGYQGNIQYALVVKNQTEGVAPQGSNDPRGIEANSSDADYVPQTNAVLANITLIGGPVSSAEPGMRLRGALTTGIYNSAVMGFDYGCVRIDDATVGETTVESDVTLVNVLGDCEGGFYSHEEADGGSNAGAAELIIDNAFALVGDAATLDSAPAITAVGGSSFMFDQTDYVGAVEPGTAAAEAWWAGWTLPGTLTDAPAQADFVECENGTTCTISGTIDEDYTLVSGIEWILDGVVRVGSGDQNLADEAAVTAVKEAGVDLTVQPGVHVRGTAGATLIVTRGSRLLADGTAANPITFSSLEDDDFDGLGEWGGIIIQGFAPQYGAGNTGLCSADGICNVAGEGSSDDSPIYYGGTDEDDDSGIVRYVRIAEGGLITSLDDEVNGLTLQGVGYNTTVEYVQVHNNLDDGVEWFGGNVNARYLVLTGNDDDDIDYDEGYRGNIQYALVVKNQSEGATPQGSNDPRGIEANSSDADYVPQTNAVLANITLIGGPVSSAEPGMRLRGALTTSIYNSAVTGFVGCVRIDDATVGAETVLSDVTLVNVLGDCDGDFYTHQVADSETNAGATTLTFDDAFAINEAAAQLGAATTITALDNGSGFVFDNTDFVGAVEPGTSAAEAWWAGWTIEGSLD